jgi:hypothetical protein
MLIPAGALSAPVNLTVTPKVPSLAGSFLAVVLSPSDVAFSKPVTLTLSLTGSLGSADAQHLALALGTSSNPATLILPTSSSDGKTFTTTIALPGPDAPAGLAAVHADRNAAAATGDPEIDAILATTTQKIAALRAAAQELEATLKFEAAIKYRIAAAVLLQGVVDDPVAAQAEFAAARSAACQKLELYDGTAATRLGNSFQNLWAALRPVLAWVSAADAVGVDGSNCPERNRLHQVLTELVQGSPQSVGFLQLYTNAMQRSSFTQNFEGLANELYQALLVRKYGSLLDLQTAFADVKSQIQLPLAQRLRTAAYNWCNSDNDQTYLGTLFQAARDGGMLPLGLAPIERLREVVDPPADFGYDAAALSDDIQYCATTLTVLTTGSGGGAPREDGLFGGLGSPGSIAAAATIPAPPHGTLELDGLLMALYCPNGSFGNDRIAVEFNGQPIRELPQVTVTGAFIRGATVSFNVADLLTQGQVPPHGGGSFPFKLIRKSDRCGGQYLPTGDPPNKELIALQLTYPNVTIAPTSVTLDPGETATFTATVQHSSQGVTWQVSGGTQTVSGNTLTFTAGNQGGNFSVTAKSVADPDRSATAAVTINDQCPAPASLRASGSAAVCLPPLQIQTVGFLPGTVGTPFDQSLGATGGNQVYNWTITVGSLPPGLALANTTGRITGTPTTAGTSQFTVRVVSAGLEATAQLSIVINPAASALFVYSGTREITIVNRSDPAWLAVFSPSPGVVCFVLNQPTRLPVVGATCPNGDFGAWVGTLNGTTLNATSISSSHWAITGTINTSQASFSGKDPALFGATTSFSGARITP